MQVRNGTETAVRQLLESRSRPAPGGWLARLTGQRQAKPACCACALCELDALALALNKLPPRYARADQPAGGRRPDPEKLRQALDAALTKVARRPKHKPSSPVDDDGALRLRNFALEEALVILESLAGRLGTVCLCEECRADTLAIALNRFPPKYGVELRGVVLLPPHQKEFLRHELEQLLEKAARFVTSRSPHGDSDGA